MINTPGDQTNVGDPSTLGGFRSPSPRLRTFNLLSSPTKVTINNTHILPKSSPEIYNDNSENEFAELSTQLSHLLKQLSEIYTEIGYSKPEIERNEKTLFDLISHTFDQFLKDSKAYKQKLSEENARTIKILRLVLKTINDPSGTRTIPDLYQRNLILRDVPKETTLLSWKKCLESSMENILKDYRERMLRYLKQSQILIELKSKVDDFSVSDDVTIPSIGHSAKILAAFEEHSNTRDLYGILVSETVLLLENESLNDLSDDKFSLMTRIASQLKAEAHKRLRSLRETSISILLLWKELDIDYKADYNMISQRVLNYAESNDQTQDLDISSAIVREISHQLDDLRSIRLQRQALMEDYSQKCEKLWSKLKEDPEMSQQFRQRNATLSMKSIESYENELERLLLKKKDFLKDFILDARNQIEDLWNQLCFDDDERDKFAAFRENVFTDELLFDHESEIERLTGIYESYKPILSLLQEFTGLIQDRENLEQSTKDSSRLLQRNSHKILMEEEKTRKRLTRQLPRVVGDLKLKMQEFESSNGPLTFLGPALMEQLDEEQKKLEAKGRRVLSTSKSRVASAAPSTVSSRFPSAAPSRVASRVASRSTSRAPSRPASRMPSRAASPIKAVTSTSSRYPLSQGVQKPSRRPMVNKPALIASESCLLPPLTSPTRETNLSITTDMVKGKAQLRVPATISRSHSSFHPQLSRLPETSSGSPRRNKISPLKTDSRSNLPLPKKRVDKITTSPLKSLALDDMENVIHEPMSSDQDDDNDTYSNWRKEQLKKLNAARQAANTLSWETDTF